MASGKSKIELIIEIKNKVKSGLSEAKARINSDVGAMKSKIAELKNSFTSSFKSLANSPALKLLLNPITLASAGVVGLFKAFDRAAEKAADFNTSFRSLANLNLDKSRQQITALKKSVLDTAFTKGFDTDKTISAFFDVQSTTGKYGAEVRKIVEKQGEFANLMQADFNNYIAGTSKAMANFGFGAEKLDDFNRSAYATVKVGVTTFDQLANVQSVYAGAAASAKQTFDTANKIFALFTVKTKSVDEAATLTKSMFNDLTKQTTIEAFKKVGINVYDNNKQLKQADTLLVELNNKFRNLDSDKKVVALKNQFSGSEGLIALIQAATDKSGQLQNTLSGFDQARFGLNDALELAKNDLNYINDQLKNKTNAALIELGEKLLPLKNWWAETKLDIVNRGAWLLNGREGNKKDTYNEGWTRQNEIYGGLMQQLPQLSKEQYEAKQREVIEAMNAYKKSYWDASKKINETQLPWGVGWTMPKELKKEYREAKNLYSDQYLKGQYDYLHSLAQKLPDAWGKATNYGLNIHPEASPLKDADQATSGGGSSNLGSSVSSVTGSAKQVRNITVNIDAFNKGGINTQNTNLKNMDEKEIESWFTDMCLRAVRNLELSY